VREGREGEEREASARGDITEATEGRVAGVTIFKVFLKRGG
jgi:hypothetical protein